MKEQIIAKIRNNIAQMGQDLVEYPAQENGIYFTEKEKRLPLSHIFSWTQSFFTGMAYWAYVETKDKQILDWLYSFEQEYYDKVFRTPLETMHDLGFLYIPYAVALYQLTGDEKMKEIGVKAADELAKRFEPRGGYIPTQMVNLFRSLRILSISGLSILIQGIWWMQERKIWKGKDTVINIWK